jgi:ribosomal protein L37AE/L43A
MKCNKCSHHENFDFWICPHCGYPNDQSPVAPNLKGTQISASEVRRYNAAHRPKKLC